ncbi:unnamed protein product [Mytilus coruscus]|uniref:EB domain-containing protein n=1 Tax=Mytilus coruscus TaxID=42192 RepID=A0A6J8CA16_MYTCO|nr:unnamed protein product [Mytilus coruscus]
MMYKTKTPYDIFSGVAYDGSCTGTGVGDCTDTNNICDATTKKCACSPTSYLKDGSTECADKIALTGVCTATPTDQCADSNAECHATDLICVCTSTYFADKNAACASQVAALNGTCDATDSASDQCAVTDAECRNDGTGSKCLCKITHYVNGAACTLSSGVVKVTIPQYMYMVPILVSMMFLLQ